MAYHFTVNTDTPIPEDGVLGAETIKALQFGLGVTVDGRLGAETIKALQVGLNHGFRPEGPVTIVPQPVPNPVPTPTPSPSGGLHLAPLSNNQVSFATQPGNPYLTGSALTAVVQDAATLAGVPQSWVSSMTGIIIPHESSGQVNAVNTTDSNAIGPTVADGHPFQCSRGLAQTIPQTFAANHAVGTSNDIYEPHANVAAAFIYIARTYGDIFHVPGVVAVNAGRGYVGY